MAQRQKMPNRAKKIVLAFSGGLDTSFAVLYLKEKGYDVVSVTVNTGGFDTKKIKEIEKRAQSLGVLKHYNIEAEKEIFERVIAYLIKLNGLYQDLYPQMCSDRYLIAEKCVEIARKEKAFGVAHGCTAAGNDQIRFDASFLALAPDLKIFAPIREFQKIFPKNLRQKEIEYLEKRGFKVPKRHKIYTINENIFGTTISGREIDQNKEPTEEAFTLTQPLARTPQKPSYAKIVFKDGMPIKLNNKKTGGVDIIKKLNKIGGTNGFGRFVYTGDCILGMKGRIVFEAPGIMAILLAHKSLEEAILSKEQNQFKKILGEKWAQLLFSGLYYDPLREDIEKFIDSNQQFVSGVVTLKFFKGSCLPVEYSSPYLLREKGVLYAQKSSWAPEEAESFGKLFSLSTKIAFQRKIKKRRKDD